MLKRYFAGLLTAVLLAADLVANAQVQTMLAPSAPKNLLKIAPLGWVHGQLPFSTESRLGYERVAGPRSGVAGSYSYLGTNHPFSFLGSAALSGFISTAFVAAGHPAVVWTDVRIRTQGRRWQLQYKRYLSKKQTAPEGFYLSPHFSYTSADYRIEAKDFDAAIELKTERRNYNLLAGYQAVLGRHFVVDVFTGLGYRDNTTKAYNRTGAYLDTMPRGTKLKLSSGLNIGWAF